MATVNSYVRIPPPLGQNKISDKTKKITLTGMNSWEASVENDESASNDVALI